MLRALSEGFAAVRRNPGLAVCLAVTNLACAALLAIPMAGVLEGALKNKGASSTMLYGFDFPWWSHHADTSSGLAATFSPDILGRGFVFKNLNLLLRGELPAGLFRTSDERAASLVLAVGALYLTIQVFLAGGLYGLLRHRASRWTVRALFHGAGFYFGRFARIAAIALVLDLLLFRLDRPLSRFVESHARESVSERAALAWLFSHHALLLFGILAIHVVSGYAKAITVLEERSSALLAFVSSFSFCVSRIARVAGHYAAIVAIGVALVAFYLFVDARLAVTGYKTQLAALALGQALIFGRTALRVALVAGQLAIYRDRG